MDGHGKVPQIAAGDIPIWTITPVERIEDRPLDFLLGLDWEALAHYAYDLQVDLRSLRATLHESLALIRRQQLRQERSNRVIEALRDELRQQRRAA